VFGPIFFTQREKLTFAFLAMGLLDRKGVRKKVRGKCSCALGANKKRKTEARWKGFGQDCAFETVSGHETERKRCERVEMRMYIERVARSVIGF